MHIEENPKITKVNCPPPSSVPGQWLAVLPCSNHWYFFQRQTKLIHIYTTHLLVNVAAAYFKNGVLPLLFKNLILLHFLNIH